MDLKKELKQHIIEQLNLEEVSVEEIENEAPLFGDGLGLDSIDALELIVLLDSQYNIKIKNPDQGKEIFQSINSLTEFIEKNRD